MRTILSGKSHSTPPPAVGRIWPATDSSPLMRIVVGPQIWVMRLVTSAKERFVMAM